MIGALDEDTAVRTVAREDAAYWDDLYDRDPEPDED